MCMTLFTTGFTFGVWLMQQQATLPPLSRAWLLAGFVLALTIPARMRIIRTLLMVAFACGIGFFHTAWQAEQRLSVNLPYEWQGRDIEVTGVVAQLPHITERGQRVAFNVEKTLTGHVQVPEHIYLSTYSDLRNPPPALHAGERWHLTVRLKQPHGSSNPHSSDFELWALENNVRATGYVNNRRLNVRISKLADGIAYRTESWREALRDKFTAALGAAPYAGILTALAIGDQDSITQSQWQLFKHTGVVHLMSISGLHITMLSGMGYAFFYWLWRRSAQLTLTLPARKAAAIAAVLIAYGYSLTAGFGVPAQRTVYMVAAVAVALWLKRNVSPGQIVSIAVLGVLISDPWTILSPGFCLSFGAVALILYTTSHRISDSPVQDAPSQQRVNAMLRGYATVQWAVGIGLIPLLLVFFWQLSLISPIANAIAIPMISLLVVPLTLLAAILPCDVPLWLAHIVLDLTIIALQWLDNMPLWIQHAPPAWCIVAGMLGVLWILLPAGFPARWLGGILMLPMFLNGPEPPAPGSARLIIFDVGQGLAVAIQTHHHILLYDTGPRFSDEAGSGNRILVPALHAMGISSLDGMILSHDDTDHTGGTLSVLKALPAGWIMSSQPAIIPVTYCRDGMSWNWDGATFDILHPADNGVQKPHDNDQSCVLRISTDHQHALLTGDIEKLSEQRLLGSHADKLSAGLLIVPHHGSSGSSGAGFVAAVLPDYAVFTSGYLNRFGHPKQQIRQRYLDSGATQLRSDQDGAILASMDAKGITVESWRQLHRRYWMHQATHD